MFAFSSQIVDSVSGLLNDKKGDKVSTRQSRRQAGIAPTPAVTNRKKKKTAPQDKSQRRHEAEEEYAQE